jgi:DNA-binding SARP family transcriptional activator
MEFHASRGDFEQSIAYCQEILRRDPLHEEIHRKLMRIYLESGQRTLAIRQYLLCRELLSKELGVPPLEETNMLYQHIVLSSSPGAPEGRQPVSSEITQLAHELHLVKRSLDQANSALVLIAQSIDRIMRENTPETSR